MDVQQLKCFITLAETLNFSQTAQILFLSQPTISNQIKQLEKELDLKLFIRTKRNVELTPAGISFYEDAKDFLTKLNQGITKAKNYAQKYNLTYSIAYEENYLATKFLSKILEKFKSLHPNVLIDLKVTDFKKKNSLFAERKIDCLFTVKDNITDDPEANYVELYTSQCH